MQLIDGKPVYSATDLVGYLACQHLTALDRAVLHGLAPHPRRFDAELEVLRKRGFEHEQRYRLELTSLGKRVIEIQPDGSIADYSERLAGAARATAQAMADGWDVIYQGTFFDGHWRGHPDFLLRMDDPDRPSKFGPYHYEVADTKLARHVKASAILQICSYVDQLEGIQALRPARLRVVLGGSARRTESFRVDDFMAYYRAVRERFEAAVGSAAPKYPIEAAPEPVEHCDVCRWKQTCEDHRRRVDHLSLVASIAARQRRALSDRGMTTLAGLGQANVPFDPPLEGSSRAASLRIREQARIQLDGRAAGKVLHELLLPVEANKGLASLPPPSSADLFLDLEGDPYALEDGLDYLFGVLEPARTNDDGSPAFHAFWSMDADGAFTLEGEKRAFEELIDLIMDRLAADPTLHVYHYAPYEPTALKRLMGRYGTREDEVDRLLRGGVLVDLYRTVRQGLRASVESYSIKHLEPLYGFGREVELRDATTSIVEFERWLELGSDERPGAAHLERILQYNRDDVVSTWRLRDWLEAERRRLVAAGTDVPRPQPGEGAPSEELGAALQRVVAVAGQLTQDVPVDPAERSPEQHARWLLAQLLSWHRREEKSTWWRYFYLMDDLTDEERIEEKEPLGGLELLEVVETRPRWTTYRYRFPPQEHDLDVGSTVHDPGTRKSAGTIVALDEAERFVDLRRGKQLVDAPHPTSLVPYQHVGSGVLQESLLRLGEWVAANSIEGEGPFRAGRELLLRTVPRFVGGRSGSQEAALIEATPSPLRLPRESGARRPQGGQPSPMGGGAEGLRRADEDAVDAAIRLGLALDRSVLPIQGPPGTGKTFTGARMIVALLAAGRRVGITANSHKVIGNLLSAACRAAAERGVEVRALQKADEKESCADPLVTSTDSNAVVDAALAGGSANLVAGTAWLWARPETADSLDVLFVDEAGQMSLANALAASHAARSVVLLGDPLQLDQPMQGTHPPGVAVSALGHLLGEEATIPASRGLFLETTWRLHPDLCRFTSDAFYEGKLTSQPRLARQRVGGASALATGSGPWLIHVTHTGNANESTEEAAFVAQAVRDFVETGAMWVDEHGVERPVGWDGVLVVAAYNVQVGAIKRLLPPQARVGTVDKFQGQEAPISFYSMASSSAEDAPRGMGFLYSRHRFNVATSRARCITIVVCSPDLIRVRARTPHEMRLVNALCQFAEHAQVASGG